MDHPSERDTRSSVEFLDDTSGSLDLAGYGAARPGWRRLMVDRRPSWFSLVVSGVMAAGAVIAIVSVYMTQLIFRPFTQVDSTYAMNGLGHYHLVGRAPSRYPLSGHAPPLGVVAIVGAAALLVVAIAAVLLKRGNGASAVNAGIACLAAGAIAAALACEALEGSGFPERTWAAGFWLLLVGASLAALAALANAARAQREPTSASGDESQ